MKNKKRFGIKFILFVVLDIHYEKKILSKDDYDYRIYENLYCLVNLSFNSLIRVQIKKKKL